MCPPHLQWYFQKLFQKLETRACLNEKRPTWKETFASVSFARSLLSLRCGKRDRTTGFNFELLKEFRKTSNSKWMWLRLIGSLKWWVSFADYRLFYRVLLQKRPTILRSLLLVATPYEFLVVSELFVFSEFLAISAKPSERRMVNWL